MHREPIKLWIGCSPKPCCGPRPVAWPPCSTACSRPGGKALELDVGLPGTARQSFQPVMSRNQPGERSPERGSGKQMLSDKFQRQPVLATCWWNTQSIHSSAAFFGGNWSLKECPPLRGSLLKTWLA